LLTTISRERRFLRCAAIGVTTRRTGGWGTAEL
jgi:hypothetical protein